MMVGKINTQNVRANVQLEQAAAPAPAPAFHVLDSPQAAAAFGAAIQDLCKSTQPRFNVPASYVVATASFGLALTAMADLLA